MTECAASKLVFSRLQRQKVEEYFDGGRLSSDAGAMLRREVDRRLRLTSALAACITDSRSPSRLRHDQQTMSAQRVFGIGLGYEDLNDHQSLREEPLFQVLAEHRPDPDRPLASAAYVLLEHLRRVVLKGTQLARAQVNTIRFKLLKVAAPVTVSVRRVVLHLSSYYPYQLLFTRVVARLVPI